MTVFNFKKKVDCDKKCHSRITENVLSICPSFIPTVNGHVTVYHSFPEHIFWITFYDKGVHENHTAKKDKHGNNIIVSTPLNTKIDYFHGVIQKKFKGKLPTEKELKKVI
jgi:hypothetical protein